MARANASRSTAARFCATARVRASSEGVVDVGACRGGLRRHAAGPLLKIDELREPFEILRAEGRAGGQVGEDLPPPFGDLHDSPRRAVDKTGLGQVGERPSHAVVHDALPPARQRGGTLVVVEPNSSASASLTSRDRMGPAPASSASAGRMQDW
nr:hypothetical protein [Mobilicoccus massiliensis]